MAVEVNRGGRAGRDGAGRVVLPSSIEDQWPAAEGGAVTSSLGFKQDPAFSPDGKELAFSWQGENNSDLSVYHIYAQLVGTATPLQLTKAKSEDKAPVWAPDGRFVAFIRQDDGYYVVPALGGPERKLASAYPERFGDGLSWSPDGKYLAVADRGSEAGTAAHIFFLSVDTGERTELNIQLPAPFVSTPAFSPDGKSLAFVSGSGYFSSDIYTVPVEGGKPRPLTSVHAFLLGLAWTPDSQQIVFSSNHAGLSSLWKVRVSGGDPEPVSIGSDYATFPSLSLTGNRLAFIRSLTDTNLWKAALSSSGVGPPSRIIASTKEDAEPSLSPDGQRIVFSSERSGSFEIYLANSDGSNQVQLTSLKAPDTGAARWSPDGKLIAFDSRYEGHSDIFVISVDGGTPRRLTSGPNENETPSWSHDGHWIYYTVEDSGTYQIWKVPAAGGPPSQITTKGGLFPVEAPDGRSLYYEGDGDLRMYNFASATNISAVQLRSDAENWRLCANELCCLEGTSPTGFFVRYNLLTKARRTSPLDIGPAVFGARGMDVSADGRTLVYTRADSIESDIMLVENFR